MFLLDSLMIAGIRWTLETVVTAAEAELNDDSVLRDRLLDAEMRRELGELSDEDFRTIEADLLGRIREIRERREGGAGPLALSPGTPLETAGAQFDVQASVAGDFHDTTAPGTREWDGTGEWGGASAPPRTATAPSEPRSSRQARSVPRRRATRGSAPEQGDARRPVKRRRRTRRT